ncbi:MAG: penicillin-insensitive murein endopeptidase [Myxococcales bacterium]|nr:penicillin-insensitive murein endopeptidase [Myxococcales bacterium]
MDAETTTEAAAPRSGIPLGTVLLLMAAMTWVFVAVLHNQHGAADEGDASGAAPPAVIAASAEAQEAAPDEATPAAAEPDEAAPEAVADVSADEATSSEGQAEPEPAAPQTEFARAFPAPRRDPTWDDRVKPPTQVRYTVRFGGSLIRVANLFKIFHHEITALNPGVDPERELAPNTRVVVYKAGDDAHSESIDYPGAGKLEGAVPMLEGPGRALKAVPWKTWGTGETVAVLDEALRAWAKRAGAQTVLVGNLSQRTGGRLSPHSTHQSGRDVDIGYIQQWDGKEELNWRKMTAQNLDAGETWALLQTVVATGAVEVIFIDRALQRLLHEHAVAQGVPAEALLPWLEYPRPTGSTDAMIQHVAGHDDHIHVRIACPKSHARCKSRARD